MSLDYSITKTKEVEVYSGNMTHNVSPMWDLAGVYDDLYNFDGEDSIKTLANLQEGLKRMKKFPSQFRSLEPENGWGTYDNAVKFLEEIIQAIKENEGGLISISK